MAAPSWLSSSANIPAAPKGSAPSFLGNVVAADESQGGFVDSAKAAVEGLERGMTGGLSDRFQNGLAVAGNKSLNDPYGENGYLNEAYGSENLPSIIPNLGSSAEEIAARKERSPVLSDISESLGHGLLNPISAPLDALGVPNGPKIFPENKYLNPTYGGVAKGLGDIAVTAPEIMLKSLAGVRPALENLSGLIGPQAEAWIKNKDLVNKIKTALESQKLSGVQDMAGGLLENTVDKLKTRGLTRADVGAKMLENKGAQIPYATEDLQVLADKGSVTAKRLLADAEKQVAQKAAEAGTVAPQLEHVLPEINASGRDIYALTQDAGRTFQESGGVHPLTGVNVPKDPNLGRIWSTSRNAMAGLPEIGPTIDTLMGRTAKEAGVQGSISPKIASENPLTIMNTSSPDQLSRLDYLSKKGMPELQNMGNAWQAAKNLSNIEYGRGAPGIQVPLHGVSPKAKILSNALNSLTGGLPQKAALWGLPFAEAGKVSPWFSLESALNPMNVPKIINNVEREKKDE